MARLTRTQINTMTGKIDHEMDDDTDKVQNVAKKRKREQIAAQSNDNKAMTNRSKATHVNKKKKNAKLMLREKINNEAPINEFVANEIVLASIPGYAPWPARILEMSGQTVVVEFLGTGQM